ncbi:MAG: imelysin family protein [Advenella sp.]|uniref:imelysin family protein n=1 Tax=Advenella sp. TaxID=1872388 RepID=UPI002588A827|nr:imelysin family protein [Advenella sp.]MDD3758659.1 imelysin family protein [Advenella sp.]
MRSHTFTKISLSVLAAFSMAAVSVSIPVLAQTKAAAQVQAQQKIAIQDVLKTYAGQAHQFYANSVKDLEALQTAINAFASQPNQATLDAAKAAWLQSRESYGLTEIFRLSEGPIDAEEGWVAEAYGALEGQINAWPLDEHMIDYTLDADNKRTSGNIIDTIGKFTPGGEEAAEVDVTEITVEAITELNENGGEANVASGYHAIEFLLWGQDQDYNNFLEDKITKGAKTAGQRPLSDFTSDPFAKRRLAYLQAATNKLLADVKTVAEAWDDKVDGNKGLYRAAFLSELSGNNADKNIPAETALRQVLAGMGVFIKSELANERIAVAVLTPSEEDEHSCFSDNTHRDIVRNYEGFKDVLLGQLNGKKIGPAPYDALGQAEKQTIDNLMGKIEQRLEKMDTLAKTSMHFDYQIMPEHKEESKNIVSMKNDMRKLGDQMVPVASAFDIKLSEEDVTDAEETQI